MRTSDARARKGIAYHPLMGGLLVVVLLITSGLAMYYRTSAEKLRQELSSAMAAAEELRAQAKPTRVEKSALGLPEPPQARSPAANSEAELAALRSRVAELETAPNEQKRKVGDLPAPSAPPARSDNTNAPPAGRRPRDPRIWLENFRTNNPAGYEEMMKRREETRQQMRDAVVLKTDHLLARDTSGMTDDERTQYFQMVRLLDETGQLADQLMQTNFPREQRFEVRRVVNENMTALRPLLKDERNKEFYELGLQMGYKPDEATGLVEYLNEAIDATSLDNIRQRMRPGGQTNDQRRVSGEAVQ